MRVMRLLKQERGAVIVETAVYLLLILLVVAALINIALMVYTRITVSGVAEMAAAAGSREINYSELQKGDPTTKIELVEADARTAAWAVISRNKDLPYVQRMVTIDLGKTRVILHEGWEEWSPQVKAAAPTYNRPAVEVIVVGYPKVAFPFSVLGVRRGQNISVKGEGLSFVATPEEFKP